MKPLFKVTISLRDPYDPSTLTPVGGLEVTSLGDINVILTRDEMGTVKLEASEVAPEPGFLEMQREAMLTFKELHEQLARTSLAIQHANTDLFALHKWMTR